MLFCGILLYIPFAFLCLFPSHWKLTAMIFYQFSLFSAFNKLAEAETLMKLSIERTTCVLSKANFAAVDDYCVKCTT